QSPHERFELGHPMVSPRGEVRSDDHIVFDLACRLGMGDLFCNGKLEDAWNHQLEPLGITIEQLRAQPDHCLRITTQHRDKKYTEGGFQTQTRRIELYSEQLLRHGYAPLPCDRPQKDALTEKQVKRYPLTLTSAKSGYY